MSCQRSDLRKTLKYSQSWDLEGIYTRHLGNFVCFFNTKTKKVMSDFHAIVERVFRGDVQAQVTVVQQHTTYTHTTYTACSWGPWLKLQPKRCQHSDGGWCLGHRYLNYRKLLCMCCHKLCQLLHLRGTGARLMSSTRRNETVCTANGRVRLKSQATILVTS